MSDRWSYTPAADTGLPEGQRLASVQRESGLVSTLGVAAATTLSKLYLRLWHRYRVENPQRLPGGTPFVMVANHASHLDHMSLRNALPLGLRVKTLPLAAGDVFFSSGPRAAASAVVLNALPVWRKRTTGKAMTALRERLLLGRVGYVLFPEGSRARTGVMSRFKPGVGMLVAGTPVPVVPCYIDGAHAALAPGARWPRPRRVRVVVGEPITFQALRDDREGWDSVAATLEDAVRTLGGLPVQASPTPPRP